MEDTLNQAHTTDPRQSGMSRRTFMQTAGMGSVAALMSANAGVACADEANDSIAAKEAADNEVMAQIYGGAKYGHAPVLSPRTHQNHAAEPELPPNRTLEELGLKNHYDVDVLVVGGGLAGVYAADRAKALGKKVLLVDKGTVMKSGLSAWCHTFAFFDESLGDDREFVTEGIMRDSEYSARLEYWDLYLDRSREIYDSGIEWGWLHPHDWSTTEQDKSLTPAQLLQSRSEFDRHLILRQHLIDADVEFIERVMIAELIKDGDNVVGAVGFSLECEEPITFFAKSVILATGCGSIRPLGFPTGADSWDGDCMAYRAGAAMTGKEFHDFHWTLADFPGDIYTMWWRSFMEGQLFFTAHYDTVGEMMVDVYNVDANGGFVTPDREHVAELLSNDAENVTADASVAENDPRKGLGNTITPDYLWLNREVKECATGMGIPKCEGVYPVDDKCWTGVNGLWVAGETLGCDYAGDVQICMGSSSCVSCITGRVCAEQACEYCDAADTPAPSEELVQGIVDEVMAPYRREVGFSPSWLEDILCNIMAPYWVAYMKSPETLEAALSQLLVAKEKAVKNLRARSMHELRYCHEMVNKFLNCEARLRASLFREESRAMHYRYDFPYRDDENWLCWVTERMGEDGEMVLEKQMMPERDKGDLSMPYTERYPYRQPGELEALGIEEPAAQA